MTTASELADLIERVEHRLKLAERHGPLVEGREVYIRSSDLPLILTALRQVDDNPFIGWLGGENPVPGARVEYRLRGSLTTEDANAATLDWSVSGTDPGDITAYRVIARQALGGEA